MILSIVPSVSLSIPIFLTVFPNFLSLLMYLHKPAGFNILNNNQSHYPVHLVVHTLN